MRDLLPLGVAFGAGLVAFALPGGEGAFQLGDPRVGGGGVLALGIGLGAGFAQRGVLAIQRRLEVGQLVLQVDDFLPSSVPLGHGFRQAGLFFGKLGVQLGDGRAVGRKLALGVVGCGFGRWQALRPVEDRSEHPREDVEILGAAAQFGGHLDAGVTIDPWQGCQTVVEPVRKGP